MTISRAASVFGLWASLACGVMGDEHPGHRVLLQGGDRLAVVEADGSISWEMPWGAIHDIHVGEGGLIYVQGKGLQSISEIDPKSKGVLWSYAANRANGNSDRRVEVHAFQPLPGGAMMVAESGAGRIIEVSRQGALLKEVELKLDRPDLHRDTRLARKLANGNYLVSHEGDGFVREYDGESGEMIWEYEVPLSGREPAAGHGPEGYGNAVFCALRLGNGHTLIATGNGHRVIEVTPEGEVVWELGQDDLAPVRLAWVTTLEVLENGNYVIGNCHAGPGQPLLVEVVPESKEVVWRFDRFEDFGNSVSNSLLLDEVGKSIR
jgi:hypothetical protein